MEILDKLVLKAAKAGDRERDAWCLRERMEKDGYEIVRIEPDKPIADKYMTVTPAGKDRNLAERKFERMRSIAQYRAALKVLAIA